MKHTATGRNDPYRLTAEEMGPEYDDEELWGQYLYKKHTGGDQHPISAETAARLSARDLEAVLSFAAVSEKNFLRDRIAADTVSSCARELALREK